VTQQTSDIAGAIKVDEARREMLRGLRNAHAMEQQSIEMMERMTERLENYPQLRDQVARHLEESRQQQALIERTLEELGDSPSALKDAVLGLVQNMQAMVHAATPDEVLKYTFTGYAFEHFEIAAYRALIVMAHAAGVERVAQTAEQILRQEEEMAGWLERRLPEIVGEYLHLLSSGEQKR
jgi:ferritin-like metal-binding protein YciE